MIYIHKTCVCARARVGSCLSILFSFFVFFWEFGLVFLGFFWVVIFLGEKGESQGYLPRV